MAHDPELIEASHPFLTEAERQVAAYLDGALRDFDLPLDLHGTPFQMKVWNYIQSIPYGETMSYGEVAEAIGHPRAMRAVGTANRHNRIALVIPCHRVIAAGGKIGGYGCGLGRKRFLLAHEQRHAHALVDASGNTRLSTNSVRRSPSAMSREASR